VSRRPSPEPRRDGDAPGGWPRRERCGVLSAGLQSLTKHADAANDLSACLEPKFFMQAAPPPMGMPTPMMSLAQALEDRVGEWSQPELQKMIESGQIPPQYLDQRPHRERLADWLIPARDLGVVRFR